MPKGKKMIDFHTHILPCIDDGARSLDESLALLQMLEEQGVDTVVFTPHYYGRKKGAEQFSRFLTMVSLRGPLDFYRTSRNFIVCGYRSRQAEFYQPLQEYLENLTEESQQK